MTTNFDDLKRLHDLARANGRGSKAYFEFCNAMFEGFPSIYETAAKMNADSRNIIEWSMGLEDSYNEGLLEVKPDDSYLIRRVKDIFYVAIMDVVEK